jgi:hypothetical protein
MSAIEDARIHCLIKRRSKLIRLIEWKRPRTEEEAKLVAELYLPELASVCLQLFSLLVDNPIRPLVTLRGTKESRTKRVMELFSSVGVVSRSLLGGGGIGGRTSLLDINNKYVKKRMANVIPFEFADSGDNVLSASLLMELTERYNSKTYTTDGTPTVGLLYDPSLILIKFAADEDAYTKGVVPDLELGPDGKPKIIDYSKTETDQFGHPLPKGTIAGLAVRVATSLRYPYNEMLISAKTARIGDAVIGGVLLNGAEHTELATEFRERLDAEKPDLPIFTYYHDSLVPFQLTAFGGRKRRGGALKTATKKRQSKSAALKRICKQW